MKSINLQQIKTPQYVVLGRSRNPIEDTGAINQQKKKGYSTESMEN